MKVGQSWSSWKGRLGRGGLGLLLGLAAGCGGSRSHVDQALLANPGQVARSEGVADRYVVHWPDVLEVAVAGRPELTGRRAVELDGQIDLGAAGRLRGEGLVVSDIARGVTELTDVPLDRVRVRVAEYNSQRVYLCGEGNGLQRAVAYQGPETVLDLLQRVGGIAPGAAPRNVYVLRANVAEGRKPEVCPLDLKTIVLDRDDRANLRLQPFDQIFVGETRGSSLQKCVPPCLLPLYKRLCGLDRPGM